MGQGYCFVLGIIILGMVLISGCVQQQTLNCKELAKNLDNYIKGDEQIFVEFPECDDWLYSGKPPIIVGGTLIDISDRRFNIGYEHYEYSLTFQGYNKQGKLNLVTYTSKSLPYQIGQFYKFDLGDYCQTILSMALSGSFVDRDLNKLEPMNCLTNETAEPDNNTIIIENEEVSLRCNTDGDCGLRNKNLGFDCYGNSYCGIVDYSEKKWIAVNVYSFSEIEQRICPPYRPGATCQFTEINVNFVAKCINNICTKVEETSKEEPKISLLLPRRIGQTWVEIDPIQCLGNPWEVDWLESHNMNYSSYFYENKTWVIEKYYKKQGITILGIQSVTFTGKFGEPMTTCLACHCLAGYRLYLSVYNFDVSKMLELGYGVVNESSQNYACPEQKMINCMPFWPPEFD